MGKVGISFRLIRRLRWGKVGISFRLKEAEMGKVGISFRL